MIHTRNIIHNLHEENNKQWFENLLKMRVTNGFSTRPSILQIISCLLFLVLFIHYYSMIWNMPLSAKKVVLFSLESAIILLLIASWFSVSYIDPTDPIQTSHIDSIMNNTTFQKPSPSFICSICKTYRSQHSFHCKKCHKCVQVFDHHCKWVNNCIGAKNYIEFIALLISLVVFLCYNSSVIIYCIVIKDVNGIFRMLAIAIGVITLMLLVVVAIFLTFHIILVAKKKTTLSLIIEVRKQKKQEGTIAIDSEVFNIKPLHLNFTNNKKQEECSQEIKSLVGLKKQPKLYKRVKLVKIQVKRQEKQKQDNTN